MLVEEDERQVPIVKIIDFGLAKALTDQIDPMSLTGAGFVGTPAFASPEQFEHSALDVRSDIYSLGITLWFALTGKTPFAGRSVEEIRSAQKSKALPVEQLTAARVPASLRSLLQSMLAFEPAARPGIQELTTQLRRCSALADIEMAADGKKEIQLEIAHVLFIDIVGYSKLSINEEQAAVDELTQIVRSVEQFQKAEAAERLIKIPSGDGMALVFYTTPEAPVRCAMQINRALKDHPRLHIRMGIHSGPVSGVDDVTGRSNLAGAGLNLAQRVMKCGDAGHILLSKRVAEDLSEFDEWRPLLHDLGRCEVKHGVQVAVANLWSDDVGNRQLPQKFQILEKRRARLRRAAIAALLLLTGIVTALILVSKKAARSTSIAPDKSIAVLPFENLSEDKANAYFADGIQDEILTRLAKITDLKVISRTSTQHYKSAPQNLPDIARQLGVAHILEGSVQKSGDAVRVSVQLIKAANDSHLWADSFDRKLTDIFSVESDVAKAIAEQLQAKLTGQEEQVIAAKPTDNTEAYDAYLRGLAYSLKAGNTSANALAAQKYLKEAVRLDPKFALAWARLSYVDAAGYISLNLQPTITLREEARQAAETALNLQPNLGEAVLANGYYHYACLKDYDTAVRCFERARQFLPNSSETAAALAYVARRRGQWDRSEWYFKEAERLDPRDASLLTQHALSYRTLRRFPEALRKFDQVLNITPDDLDTLAQKARIAQARGDLAQAAAILAPLRPGADLPRALETQVYQAILERRPAPVIPRLKEILAKPDPALGFYNSELRFWLGWAQEVAGDAAAAHETWKEARSEMESLLKEQPNNPRLIGHLALTNMGLGDKAAALAAAEQAIAAVPIGKDAIDGARPSGSEVLARVAAQIGQTDRAISALQELLSVPYRGPLAEYMPLTPALLRLDPMFDPLRADPRFQELCKDKQP
jgi:TolB-like protein/class 3 adenylate cyclase/Tfp pilus assembly protein PilF